MDAPDCSYRGMMVDLARNWHDFTYLISYVDMCYYYKISVLHLHFTDDQSYTLPSKRFPKLSTKGRSYTPEQIEALNQYAEARGIQLMPEIDVPGHCISFQKEYPDIFEYAAQKLSVAPERCIVFDDVLPAIRSAKQAKMLAGGVYDKYSADQRREIEKIADIYLLDFKLAPIPRKGV